MMINDSLFVWTSVVFWICVAAVAYAYVGYPTLLAVFARLFGKRQVTPSEDALPTVTIVVAAHNEESVIEERVRNLLALDYPADRIEILIASDGSTDRTCDLVRRFVDDRIRLLDFGANRGKSAVLNDALSLARGEVVVMSDANTMMDPAAARRLARWFRDPSVGVVCGRLVLVDSATGSNADGLYWKFETYLKRWEARLGALLGANGAIYAIRRSLFPELPQRIAVDDFVIPLLARLRHGCGLVYEPMAIATEETPPEMRSEFSRRSRIGAGGFQSLSLLWPLINPMQGWIAFAFLSHKVLRWICPFFLLGAAATSLLLISEPLYRGALLAQVMLYAAAVAGFFWPAFGARFRAARLPAMFAAMNLALLAGFFLWASGRQGGVWRRTARPTA
jgi:cellulose synthase/poly-beta-1,6-N-acetylglucosamine synthase-like glycosyltransferase